MFILVQHLSSMSARPLNKKEQSSIYIFCARSLKTKVHNVNIHKKPKLIILSFEVPKAATECVCAS